MNNDNSISPQKTGQLLLAAFAAFCTYFCMYAFRKPFSAGTFEGQEIWGLELKGTLVLSQIVGYMISKFVGIRIVSEMKPQYRAVAIIGLIVFAELALVGFAFAPYQLKPFMLFFNGLPLGMIFGLVLAYLEGRKQTEALSAVLCASFIISSGVVKSIGRWMVVEKGVSEFFMPMYTGLIFLIPLMVSVFLLQLTPQPDQGDIDARSERKAMSRNERWQYFKAYWPGLSLLVFVYILLTLVRTLRDDFGVEIWRDMGTEKPDVFAKSETIVAIIVMLLSALAICFKNNVSAIRATIVLMSVAFGLSALSAFLQSSGTASPFSFMVLCGIGLYIPYVAFHTTIFERIVAASKHPCNLGFLMYLADAIGYLGYSFFLVGQKYFQKSEAILPFFRTALLSVSCLCVVCLVIAMIYFQTTFAKESQENSPEQTLQPETS